MFVGAAYAQTIPEAARRHMTRGQAAIEMARSPHDLDMAAKEFQEATRLAPAWPEPWYDPWYDLAGIEEKTGKFKEAVGNLKKYLRLTLNAPNAAKIRERIYKLEFKAEQILTVPEIIDALLSFLGWECNQKHYPRLYTWGELKLERSGADAVRALRIIRYDPQILKITGPVLKYETIVNVCDRSANARGSCDSIVENEIEVVSRTLVRVNQAVVRGGGGAGVRTGQKFACTFQKK